MGSYDHWKSTNPEDEWLGPEPEQEEDPPEKTPGQIACEAYWAENLPIGIKPTPWERLEPEVRAAWEAAAQGMRDSER